MPEYPRYQVICLASCGKQPLTEEQYHRGLQLAHEPWECPKCGAYADWDDESLETNGPEEES